MARSIGLVALAASLAFGGAALAESRHCDAWFYANLTSGVSSSGQAFFVSDSSGAQSWKAARMRGRGTCKKHQPNTCRENARSAILSCANAVWEHRWENIQPPDACGSSHDARPPHANVEHWGPPGIPSHLGGMLNNNIKRSLEYSACCIRPGNPRELRFSVSVNVSGDRGCSRTHILESDYRADCAKLRSQGLCSPTRTNP